MTKKQNKETERMQLTVDYAFKRVFGRNGNESILKDFLEAILDIEINSITIHSGRQICNRWPRNAFYRTAKI